MNILPLMHSNVCYLNISYYIQFCYFTGKSPFGFIEVLIETDQLQKLAILRHERMTEERVRCRMIKVAKPEVTI